tara:strand:+ start:290 stop:556 length:267 start_codon:yes stop_codon:yes gene_type:complete
LVIGLKSGEKVFLIIIFETEFGNKDTKNNVNEYKKYIKFTIGEELFTNKIASSFLVTVLSLFKKKLLLKFFSKIKKVSIKNLCINFYT